MAREVSSISQIKSNILRPALTSQYMVQIPLPPGLPGVYVQNIISVDQEKLNLLCCDTTLPGSSLLTSEAVDDRTGVTERHAYRRNYGQQINMTFYVDAEKYLPIVFFESWMALITGEDLNRSKRTSDSTYSFRFRYPKDYQSQQGLKIKKFERDYYTQTRRSNPLEDIINVIAGTDLGTTDTNKTGGDIEYEFYNAFPVAINSMPISYETSQLLKCTVSFAYTKYSINRVNIGNINKGRGGGPSAGENALKNLFGEARQSLINDPNATDFINPQDFINRFGSSNQLQDAPPADSRGRTINPLTNSSNIA